MITFRYHVVSIVAVLLALAAGVALGGGPLASGAATTTAVAGGDQQANAELEAEVSALRAGDEFTDDFARTLAPGLLRGRLRGRAVTVVVLPTARTSDIAALGRLVTTAGGSVAGTVRARGRLVDVGSKQLVDELGTRLEAKTRGVPMPPAVGPYERIGALLARAVGTRADGGSRVDGVATTILGAMDAAGLVSTEGRLSRRGDLVLMVTGPGTPDPARRAAAGTVVASLARGLAAGTAGVVLTGPVASARDAGPVAAVRETPAAAREVSTVDALERSAGQVVSVLALVEQGAGRSGHYGTANAADGVLPATRD